MKRFVLKPLLAALLLAGCSGSGGGLSPNYNGDGNIIVSSPVTQTQFITSASNPYEANGNFDVIVYEDHYTGTFTPTIVQQNGTCFTAKVITTLSSPAVEFDANPTQMNDPCTADSTDPINVVATIADSKGHSVNFYFQLVGSILLAQSASKHTP